MAENDGFDDITTALPNNNTTDITKAPAAPDESPYASIVKTPKENPCAPEKSEKPEIRSNDANGVKYQGDESDGGYVQLPVAETRDSNEKGKQKSSENSMIPKVLKFLTVVLLIAVIAMAFVLYHLDQEISKNDTKTSNQFQAVKKDIGKSAGKQVTQLQQKLDDLGIELKLKADKVAISKQKNETKKLVDKVEMKVEGEINHAKKSIETVDKKTNIIKKDVEKIKTNDKKSKEELTKLIKNNKVAISKQKNDTSKMVANVKTKLEEEIIDTKKSINTVDEKTRNITEDVEKIKTNGERSKEELTKLIKNNLHEITAAKQDTATKITSINATAVKNNEDLKLLNKTLTTDVEEQKSVSKELNETVTQLNMYLQFQQRFNKTVGMSFADVLRLTRLPPDRVSEDMPQLKALAKAQKDFTAYNKKWGIQYKDVIKLVKELTCKGGNATFLLKIDYMYKEFNKHKAKWDIKFPGVFKWLTNLDFKVNGGVPLIRKIEHMYTEFNKSYHHKWKMEFKDVWKLVKKIDLNEKGTVPLLEKINSWYVDNFRNIWGDSFKGLIIQLAKSGIIDSGTTLKNLQRISQKNGTLKFLPATFEIANTTNTMGSPVKSNLAVLGYILATYKNVTSTGNVTYVVGTINRERFSKNEAKILCRDAGYNGGSYAPETIYHKIKFQTGRSKLPFLFSSLYCEDTAKTIADCKHSNDKKFEHSGDVAIECTF